MTNPEDEENDEMRLVRRRIRARGEEVRAKLQASLLTESDRGCIIFGAALLSEGLEQLLKSFFRQGPEDEKFINPLFDGYAPLSTFSAKLQLAYALAILPRDLRDNIELIRRLRNDFAHESGPLTFNDPRCGNRLRALFNGPLVKAVHKEVVKEAQLDDPATMRVLFAHVLGHILGYIHGIVEFTTRGIDIRAGVLRDESKRKEI
jgi:DNA-binding MltR family transcriptional regulator